MDTYTIRGSAHIGWRKMFYPFVTLTATKDKLTVVAKTIGVFEFTPDDIAELEVWQGFDPGIHIVHRKTEYPKYMRFWALADMPPAMAKHIAEAGFKPRADPPRADMVFRSPVASYLRFIGSAVLFAVLFIGFMILIGAA